tara:strand:- start:7272 stop:8648 length:1377 start_codon:yes stop_codon:yes gene_type:complete
MGSDGQGAYSLSLLLRPPASYPPFIGVARYRANMDGTPTTIGDTPGTNPALSVLDCVNTPVGVIMTSAAFIASLIDRMTARATKISRLLAELRRFGFTGGSMKTMKKNIVEAMSEAIVLPQWPAVLTMTQAQKFADAGVFSESLGQKARLVPNTGQADRALDKRAKVAKALNMPLLSGWSQYMAHSKHDAPFILATGPTSKTAINFNEWAEGAYGGVQYSPKMRGHEEVGERGFSLKDREASLSSFQNQARDGCAKNATFLKGLTTSPRCRDMNGNPVFNASNDVSGVCRQCGGPVVAQYRHDVAFRNNLTLKMPCVFDEYQPGPRGADTKLRTTRVSSGTNYGISAQVGYDCPTGARDRRGKKVRKNRRAPGSHQWFIFTVYDDESDETFNLVGRAFVESSRNRGHSVGLLSLDAWALLHIDGKTHDGNGEPLFKQGTQAARHEVVEVVNHQHLGAL